MLNPYPYKPVHVRQTNPPVIPTAGPPGVHPPSQPPGYLEGMPPSFGPEGQYSPYPFGPQMPASPAKSGLLGNFNFGQIKQIIDRMGGIDGVLTTVGKVQKLMQSVQQLAPMLKLLIPKTGAKTASDEEEWEYERPRRRRRRARPRTGGSPSSRRRRTAGYRRRTGYSRRRR